ncbi:MAG: PAS domain-containing protein [Pseudomonadota bacterium]
MLLQVFQSISVLAISVLALFPLAAYFSKIISDVSRAALTGTVLGLSVVLLAGFEIQLPSEARVDFQAGPLVLAGYLGGPIGACVATAVALLGEVLQGDGLSVATVSDEFLYAGGGAAFCLYRARGGNQPNVSVLTVAVLVGITWLAYVVSLLIAASPILFDSEHRQGALFVELGANAVAVLTVCLACRLLERIEQGDGLGSEIADRFALATESADVGVWDWEPHKDISHWSSVQYDLHDVPQETPIDFAKWSSLVHPADLSKLVEIAESSKTDGVPFDAEYRIKTRDGDFRHLKSVGRAIPNGQGNSLRLMGVCYDISLLRRIEKAAAVQQERFEITAENVPGVVIQCSASNAGDKRLDYISNGCTSILGISPEEIDRDLEKLWSLVEDRHVEGLQRTLEDSARDLTPWAFSWCIRRPDGAIRWLDGRGHPHRLGNGWTTWHIVAIDVTERISAQEQLEASQELFFESQKHEALGKLTGGVAHDFNNLLGVILGNAEVLRDHARHEDTETLDAILDACSRGARLTHQLLSFIGRAALVPVALDLNSVVSGVERLLRHTMPASVRVDTVRGGGLWPIHNDPNALGNALLNLALNARDAMPDGGVITIETANFRLDSTYMDEHHEDMPPGRYVMVAVSDDGTGMTKDIAKHAFEPFFTTKSVEKGSGMGLAMVRGFVKQSNGIIRLYSEPGLGTTVKLFFPANDDPLAPNQQLHAGHIELGGSEHILLVEDNDALRQTVTRQLRKLGYKVSAIENGKMALERIEADRTIDLMLTDIVMPGPLQGPDLAREAIKRRGDLRVVFMTGYAKDAAINGTTLQANNIVLMKPVSQTDLARALRTALTTGGATDGSRDEDA